MGLTREDFAQEDLVDVFPDNWDVVCLFSDLSTQWRMGMSGPTGIDYSAIQSVLRLRNIKRTQWSECFSGLQIMEDEALKTIRGD